MAVHLEVSPERLKSLRTRLGIPFEAGAKRARVSGAQLERWEREPTKLDVGTLQKLAKAYNHNWYVFLLEDEPGQPAIPHDFRRKKDGTDELGPDSLLAIDNAWLLLDRIDALGPPGDSIVGRTAASLGDDPEDVAASFRSALDAGEKVSVPDSYALLRLWRDRLTNGGVYVAQVPMPIDEVRAFCLSRRGAHLIVLSNKDYPTARAFSLIHEVGHLILGSDALCRPSARGRGIGTAEPWCNRFAASVLMPQAWLEASPRFHELVQSEIRLGSGQSLAKEFGVSELALLRRLETFGYITTAEYQRLEREAEKNWNGDDSGSTGFLEHKDKIIARESPLFVRQVFDAYGNGEISYREIGTFLDVPLRSIPGIREAVG